MTVASTYRLKKVDNTFCLLKNDTCVLPELTFPCFHSRCGILTNAHTFQCKFCKESTMYTMKRYKYATIHKWNGKLSGVRLPSFSNTYAVDNSLTRRMHCFYYGLIVLDLPITNYTLFLYSNNVDIWPI